jgi:NADH-ubiquinone oxidoreductase chain 5
MMVPLILLAILSVLAGYLLNDGLIGWGTSFWNVSLVPAPSTVHAVSSHMIPLWASWLPFVSVFLGLGLAYSYTWPMPWCAETSYKTIYLFLQSRWMFDYVWNQQVAAPVLTLGSYTWASLDKGFLEVLGPRGLTTAVSNWAVPSMSRWQSGAVQDYALVYQVIVLLGFLVLAYPAGWFPTLETASQVTPVNPDITVQWQSEIDFKIYTLALFLFLLVPS